MPLQNIVTARDILMVTNLSFCRNVFILKLSFNKRDFPLLYVIKVVCAAKLQYVGFIEVDHRSGAPNVLGFNLMIFPQSFNKYV